MMWFVSSNCPITAGDSLSSVMRHLLISVQFWWKTDIFSSDPNVKAPFNHHVSLSLPCPPPPSTVLQTGWSLLNWIRRSATLLATWPEPTGTTTAGSCCSCAPTPASACCCSSGPCCSTARGGAGSWWPRAADSVSTSTAPSSWYDPETSWYRGVQG